MSKSIIEKLGITAGPWIVCGNFNDMICGSNGEDVSGEIFGLENFYLIKTSPEMLEALIEIGKTDPSDIEQFFNKAKVGRKAVEKATGKSWEEIKEML